MARTATRTARTATATAPVKGKGKGKATTAPEIIDGGTLSRLEDGGLILRGLPYTIPGIGRTWSIMGSRGLGWTYDKSAKGWTTATPGAASEMLATLAEKSIHVVDDRKGKATTATAPVKATTARTATAPVKATTAKGATLADVIRTRLEGTDIPAEVLAEIIGHAEKVASRTARTATATATGTRTARTARTATAKGKGKGAPVKVDASAVEVVKAGGTRVFTLPAGVDLKGAATLARRALAAGGFDGVHVKRDIKGRALVTYADKGKVSGKVDAVILSALEG